MTTHLQNGRHAMTCDACGTTKSQAHGMRAWFELTMRAPTRFTLLSAAEDPTAYGPPTYLDACSPKCLGDLYQKHGGFVPAEICQLIDLEEEHAA